MGIGPFTERMLPEDLRSLPTIEAEVECVLGKGKKVPSLEAATFDAAGNFYCCMTAPNDTYAKKITPEGEVSDFCHFDEGMVIGLAFHKDGRCFATDMMRGSIRQISPEGEAVSELFLRDEDGSTVKCDCMAFDDDGTLLVTDLRGTEENPCGAIWKLSPEDDYRSYEVWYRGLASPNGICLSHVSQGPVWDSDAVWVAESAANSLTRIVLDGERNPVEKQYSPMRTFRNPGKPNMDSVAIDAQGNMYVGIMFGGRVLVLDQEGLPRANVIVPGYEEWKLQYTPNLAIRPDRAECYLLASDAEQAAVLKFPTIDKSQELFSMK